MPRTVRNFWLDATVDGRANDIGTGGSAKDAGMNVVVKYREDGSIADETITVRCESDGKINSLNIFVGGVSIWKKEVLR